jgi:hypothetical protein
MPDRPPRPESERVLLPQQEREELLARWEKHRAKGRTDFIVRRGIIGWGVPAALVTIFYRIVKEQGFVVTPQLTASLRTAILVALVIFPLCGWLFGRWLWTTGEAQYEALAPKRRVSSERDQQGHSAPR